MSLSREQDILFKQTLHNYNCNLRTPQSFRRYNKNIIDYDPNSEEPVDYDDSLLLNDAPEFIRSVARAYNVNPDARGEFMMRFGLPLSTITLSTITLAAISLFSRS